MPTARPDCACGDGAEARPTLIVVPREGAMRCEWCVEDLRPAGSWFGCRLYLLERGSETASRTVVEPPQEAWHAEPLPHRIERPELVFPSETRDAPVETPGAGRVLCHPGGTMFARFALVPICRPEGEELDHGGLPPPYTPEEAGGGGGGGGEEHCDCSCFCWSFAMPPEIREADGPTGTVDLPPPPPPDGASAVVVGPPAIPPHLPPVPPPKAPGVTIVPPEAPPHDLPLSPLHPLTPLQAMGPGAVVAAWPGAGRRPEPATIPGPRGPRVLLPSDVEARVEAEGSADRPALRVLMPPLHPGAERRGFEERAPW